VQNSEDYLGFYPKLEVTAGARINETQAPNWRAGGERMLVHAEFYWLSARSAA
jgi:hypothetical protein